MFKGPPLDHAAAVITFVDELYSSERVGKLGGCAEKPAAKPAELVPHAPQ